MGLHREELLGLLGDAEITEADALDLVRVLGLRWGWPPAQVVTTLVDSVIHADDNKKQMPHWTVIGYYEDTAQAFADFVEAENAMQAMALVGAVAESGLVLVGAIGGEHQLAVPDEEYGRTVHAEDMADGRN